MRRSVWSAKSLKVVLVVLLSVASTYRASADTFPFEVVLATGPNNVVDSNASSCDSVEGCYTRIGTRCSDNPTALCDLQIVPAGRCSYGNLATGLASCVWPHRAGRCVGNIKVGCLTSTECSGLSPNTCDLSIDKFGRPADPNDAAICTCQGTNSAGADFELTICGGGLSVCSDGDPTREVGGLGVGLGVELKLGGVGSQTFPGMGPAVTGSSTPNASPSYGLENPPVNFDPQRDAGSVGRTPFQGTGIIRQARTTDAREIAAYAHPTIANPGPGPLNVRKITSLGDSYWGDWFFMSSAVAPPFNTHIVTYTCDPPVGWVVGTPVNAGGQFCHQAARNGISFLWEDDLTAAQKTAYSIAGVPVCPPHCYKDFDISTMELQELNEAGLLDPNAGIQLAIQSGEVAPTRVAGARDAIGVAAVTSLTYLVDNDLRCKLGGWGNAPGEVGRCVDGPRTCVPGSAGDVACGLPPDQDGVIAPGVQGGSCRACNGPFNAITNPLGLPIGYNTHGRAELELVANQRIGGIAGQNADVRVPLFVVGTSGNAASDFRDIANEGVPAVDLADMGPVDPGFPFASGIGAGGTFTGGTTLNIDEACCGTSGLSNVIWDPAQLGTVVAGFEDGFSYRFGPGGGDIFLSDWSLTYDKGPGPDGIPGCIGDNVATGNGVAACDQKLGFGPVGAKTNGAFATGLDDRTLMYSIGSVTKPASAPKFLWRDAEAPVVAYFGLAQNPPTTNSVAAFTLRDLNVFVNRSADVLVKVNTTQCPLTNTGPVCTPDVVVPCGSDVDSDGICDPDDNCVNVSNVDQANTDGDLFGNVCDNCSAVANNDQADGDADGRGTACDNCPTVANGVAQAAVANVGNQIDGTTIWTVGQVLESTLPAGPVGGGAPGTGDGVGDACDSCPRARNPRVVPALFASEAAFFTANQWATLTGGQRDDDHDGFGNKCDGDFTVAGALTGTSDLAQWRGGNGKARSSLTACGATPTTGQRCGRYDMDESGALINTADLSAWRLENGTAAGPKCPTCPLTCTSGTSVTCASPP